MKINIEGDPDEVLQFLRSIQRSETAPVAVLAPVAPTPTPVIPEPAHVVVAPAAPVSERAPDLFAPENPQKLQAMPQAPDKDAVASFLENRPAKKTTKGSRQDGIAMRDLIMEFLKSSPRSSSRDIRTALGETKTSAVSARLRELALSGHVRKIDQEGTYALYELREDAPESKQRKPKKAPIISHTPSPVDVDAKHADFLKIVGEMVKQYPDANYHDLEHGLRKSDINRTKLSERLLELERMKLITRAGGRRAGPVTFKTVAPTSQNEMPLAYSTTEDAIIAALLEHKALNEENISTVTMRHSGIAAKLSEMEKSGTILKRGGRYTLPRAD